MKLQTYIFSISFVALIILAIHLTGCSSTDKVVASEVAETPVLRPVIEGSVRQARIQGADTTFTNMSDVQIELRDIDDILLGMTRTDTGGLFRISSPDLLEDESFNLIARAIGVTLRTEYAHTLEYAGNIQIIFGDISYVIVQDRRLEIEVTYTGNPASVRPGN